MAAFDDDIQTAKELIEEFGEQATVRRITPGVPTVPGQPVPPTVTNIPVSAVWLNYNLQSSGELYVGGSLIKSTDKKVLVAALDVQDISPSDQIIRATGEVFKVVNAKLLDPNGQKILWTLQAER